MLFAVKMEVALPRDLDPDIRTATLTREKAFSQELQRSGEWVSIWRLVGQYSNLSIFDVRDNDRLHEILWKLPLFAFMTIEVTPLTEHSSDISASRR